MPDKFGDKIRLLHAKEAINTIEVYVKGIDFKIFTRNSMIKDACIRQVQVIGEALNKVSGHLKEGNPEIPWRQIIGLRIIVVHQYFGVDDKILWDVIQNDLPSLKIQLDDLLKLV